MSRLLYDPSTVDTFAGEMVPGLNKVVGAPEEDEEDELEPDEDDPELDDDVLDVALELL